MGQQLKDKDGRSLGYFLTDEEYFTLLEAYVTRPFDETTHQELLSQMESGTLPKGKTTAEVLELIKSWETSPPVFSR